MFHKLKKLAIFILMIPLILTAGCSNEDSNKTNNSNSVISEGEEDADNNSVFMEEKYGISEEELKDLDVDRFVEDYRLRELDYTPEEVKNILKDQRQYYIKDGSENIYGFIEKEYDGTAEGEENIIKIGYLRNEGTELNNYVFDFENNEFYVNDITSHNFTDAQQEKIKSAYADAGVINWKKDYQGKEIPNTGSFGWKMVFEYKDGTFFVCEGFTGDGSHLPDQFDSVDKVLLEIANSD